MANVSGDIEKLLTAMKEKSAEIDALEKTLGTVNSVESTMLSMSSSLADIVSILEEDSKKDDTEDKTPEPGDIAIRDTLEKILAQMKVEKEDPPQTIQVNVPAPVVTVMPAQSEMKGFKMVVTSRDGNGAIREVSFRPEG